jgi:protoheme IX farnesyltransferase
MARTAQRPLPAERLHPVPVLNFVAVSLAVGMSQLFLSVSPLAAGWAGASWLIYVVVYTPLKMRTEWNTAVGAVAGALPALIGWSAVGGSFDPAADPRGLVLFFVLFLWQFPHFMAIAWIYRQQYRQAGMQMMTVTDPSGARAAAQAVAAALGVLAVSLIPSWFLPWPAAVSYAVAAALLGAAQVACAVGFFRRRTDAAARRMLRATLLYLPLWLTALVLHAG